jgi:hypothetical protein
VVNERFPSCHALEFLVRAEFVPFLNSTIGAAMRTPVEVLAAEALSLPQPDRSRLIDRLIASLEKDPEWESAWSEGADRREERIAKGEASRISGSEVATRIRNKLA